MTAKGTTKERSYQELVATITTVINEWDPYGLIWRGAPKDEFEVEVARIAAIVSEIKTPEKLAKRISEIFSEFFGPDGFQLEKCRPVASRLFVALQDHGFLERLT